MSENSFELDSNQQDKNCTDARVNSIDHVNLNIFKSWNSVMSDLREAGFLEANNSFWDDFLMAEAKSVSRID